MARVPAALFRQDDIPNLSDAKQVDRFFRLLNAFCKATESAFTRQITIGDNLSASWKEMTFTSGAAGEASFSFAYDLPNGQKPRGITIWQAVSIDDNRNETPVSVSACPAWKAADGKVTVSGLGGLGNSVKYRILILVVGG